MVGRYCGVDYRRLRISDVMRSRTQAFAWFVCESGRLTGDHFATLRDLKAWVDAREVTTDTPVVGVSE
jgi:hypothetical protein